MEDEEEDTGCLDFGLVLFKVLIPLQLCCKWSAGTTACQERVVLLSQVAESQWDGGEWEELSVFLDI